jgi:hypothetical protein
MILDHCLSLLSRGRSDARASQFVVGQQVLFKLQSGVSARKLDSLKTALLMIELVKAGQKVKPQTDQIRRFDNFVNYIFNNFSEPVAMALVKYAVADRKLVVRDMSRCESWSRVSALFKPVMMDDSKDPLEVSKYRKFEKIHKKLKPMIPLSNMMADFVNSDMVDIQTLSK